VRSLVFEGKFYRLAGQLESLIAEREGGAS
jgi:hypothetical protein